MVRLPLSCGLVVAIIILGFVHPTRAEDEYSACVWDTAGGVTLLPTPAGYGSEALGINDAGHVVGLIRGPQDGAYEPRAVLWYKQAGRYTRYDLRDANGATATQAVDINNDNWIVGDFFRPGVGSGAFCYEPGPALTGGVMHEIPWHGQWGGSGPTMNARALSETGWVAGTFGPGDPDLHPYTWHGFRYDAYHQTAFDDVGALTGDAYYGESSGYDIDNFGRSVGRSRADSGADLGFLYDGGPITAIDAIDWAAGITATSGHVVGSHYDSLADEQRVRIIRLERPGDRVEVLPLPPGASGLQALGLNNRLDVIAGRYPDAWWFDYSAAQWHPITKLTGRQAVPAEISDTGLIAGSIRHHRAEPLALARGGGRVTHRPTGFLDHGFTTAGLPAGARALDQIVELDDLALVPDAQDRPMASLVLAYNEPELLDKGLDESTLRLYWYDPTAQAWALAGRTSNLDPDSGRFVAGPPTDLLGDWGVDVERNRVWANIDHASTYAVGGVPEPTTLPLFALAALTTLRRRRRRRSR